MQGIGRYPPVPEGREGQQGQQGQKVWEVRVTIEPLGWLVVVEVVEVVVVWGQAGQAVRGGPRGVRMNCINLCVYSTLIHYMLVRRVQYQHRNEVTRE